MRQNKIVTIDQLEIGDKFTFSKSPKDYIILVDKYKVYNDIMISTITNHNSKPVYNKLSFLLEHIDQSAPIILLERLDPIVVQTLYKGDILSQK